MATEQQKYGIAQFAALKTAIANGEAQLVKELLPKQAMPQQEKNYLIDLAELNNNRTIIELLENIPVRD